MDIVIRLITRMRMWNNMNGFLGKAIPIALLALFVAVMTTGGILKQPMKQAEDVVQLIEQLEKDVLSQNWESASDHLEKTKKAWTKIVNRIQFSAERDEINELHKALERTGGFIKAEDKGGAMAELAEARNIWKGLGK